MPVSFNATFTESGNGFDANFTESNDLSATFDARVDVDGALPSDDLPLMDGEASPGVGRKFSRSDHRHPSDSTKANVADLSDVATSGDYNDLTNKPTIPDSLDDLTGDSTHRLVTDTEKAAWNAKYAKPSGGIPASDLALAIQTSLGKADTALQSHQDISGKADKADVYTKDQVDQKLVGAMDYKGTKVTVSALPTSGNKTGDVWHITADGSEWAWNGSAWEELGTAVDLSGYRTASAQDEIDSAQNTAIAAKYTKPSGGIPDSDIASAATWNAKGTYSKPGGGIPKTDLASDVQTSLGKADTALQQHQSLAAYRTSAAQDTIDAGKLNTTGNAYRAASIPFGQVDSTSTATAFTVSVPGITELRDGVCAYIRNGVVTSASGFTVNVNSLGAKPCYSSMAAATRATTIFNINYTMLFVYNEDRVSGGCWDLYYGYYSDSNSIGYQLRTTSTTMPTLDKFYRYRLLFTAADRKHYVPANTSSSTSADTAKTTTQRPIDPFGAIFYYGHTTAINANANPTASYFWTQYSFALGYSFNRTGSALTLTNHAPVYIKCAPQSDGSAIIDADTPYVQTLPSTADGKIYIFLGIASSATAVELVPEHPVFCYRNGMVQPWTPLMAELDALTVLDEEAF